MVKRLDRKFHAINAAGVFFHLEELHSVTEGIREALEDNGVFVVQFLYMKRIVDNLAYLDKAKQEGKTVWGFGAPVKGNTMLNYFGVGTNHLDYLVEKNELRRELYSPGMHIPIVIEKELTELPDIYYVLAWNFKKEILANNQHLIDKGIEFYFPVNPQEI